LLKEEKVAVVPGNAFGQAGEGYVRCSYAASVQQLTQALERISRFVQRRLRQTGQDSEKYHKLEGISV